MAEMSSLEVPSMVLACIWIEDFMNTLQRMWSAAVSEELPCM